MENTLHFPEELLEEEDEKENFYTWMWHDAGQKMVNDLVSSGMTAEQAEKIVSFDHPFYLEEYHIYHVNECEIELCEEDYEINSYRYDEYWDDIRILNKRGVDISSRIFKEAKTYPVYELGLCSEIKIIKKELIPEAELPVVVIKRYGYGYKTTRSSYYIFTKEKTEPTYALNNSSAKEVFMNTFTYNLVDYLSDEFKRFLKNPVDIKFDFFKEAELSDFDFEEDLLEAVEKQTGIPASILKERYHKQLITIAKEIAVNIEIIGFYSGFFKKLLAPTFRYELHDILPAGKELTIEVGDVFNLETYRFMIDFDKLSEYDKNEFFKSHSKLTPQGLLDFLGYNFRRFENAIYRAIYEIQGYEYFDFAEAKKELKYQLENQLPLKLSVLAEK